MKHDLSSQCGLHVCYDDVADVLEFDEQIIVEEQYFRKLHEMRSLFVDAGNLKDDFHLYSCYNAIYHKKHQAQFKEARLKYEITVLPAFVLNNEYLKAHGHIHSIRPIKQSRHVEIYEILNGEGVFEMFKEIDGKLNVVLMKAKVGDRFIVPGDYFHLSINTGKEPFIFGDLITYDASNDYGPLKIKNGAPFFAMRNQFGNPEYLLNNNYDSKSMSVSFVDISTLPWNNPVPIIPFYPQFLAQPEVYSFLSE